MLRSLAMLGMLAATTAIAPCVRADDAVAEKRRAARAAAEAMIRPSGPVRLYTAATNTPAEWRPRGQVIGTYANHADRERYVLPVAPWFGFYRGWGGFFGGGCWRGGVGIWGYSTW